MKFVAITACTTGIAHTYMAAERLENAAKKMGYDIKVETQGAMGVENKVDEKDIKDARCAIMAIGIPIFGKERFNNINKLEVPIQEAIKNPEQVLLKALKMAQSENG